MGERIELSPAYERLLVTARGLPVASPPLHDAHRLEIAVVFTSFDTTLAALRRAATLAAHLVTRITLVVPQVVPFPLPLSSPPVLLDFSERRLSEIARSIPVDVRVRLYLCRDRMDAVRVALPPRSLVVVGGRSHWWPTREKTLARALRRAGHDVIFTEME